MITKPSNRKNIEEESSTESESEIRRSIFAMRLKLNDATGRCVEWKWITLATLGAGVVMTGWRLRQRRALRRNTNSRNIVSVALLMVHEAKNFV